VSSAGRTGASAAGAAAGALLLAGLLTACGGGPGQPAESPSGRPSSPASLAQADGLIVFDGDSLTEGYMLAPSQSYPSQAMAQLPGWLASENFGISGQTWPELLGDVSREVDPLFSLQRRLNLVVAWAGANDLAVGYTPREVYENARRYCEARRRRGFTVITLTMFPLQPMDVDAGYEARRRVYNALLREHWREFADALVDVSADARIGDASGAERARYFIDAVHLTEAGYGVIADCVVSVIRPIVERAAPEGT
jgi:acyl-CoA thioesterase-1